MTRSPGKYFDSELIARISRLELTARRVVDGFLSGKNKSNRFGFSVEFVEHREYVPGDDLRHLDWKVLGRLDRYYIKRYEEETNITSVLIVDSSASMTLGTGKWTKFEAAATTASALGYLLNRQRDAVGLALFDEELRAFHSPSVRLASLAGLITKLNEVRPKGETGLLSTVQRVSMETSRRSLVILISDLFLPSSELSAALQFLQFHGHEAIVLHVLDNSELTFPFGENTLFRGLEDGKELLAEPQRLRERYLQQIDGFLKDVRKTCDSFAFDYQLVNTHDSLSTTLATLLALRNRRRPLTRKGTSH